MDEGGKTYMKRAFFWLVLSLVSAIGILVCSLFLILISLPQVTQMKHCLRAEMNQVWLCPKSETYVPLKQISLNLKNAVLISEDIEFYHHNGFSID
jgi:membrane peptidoglycan carboxypeptidase